MYNFLSFLKMIVFCVGKKKEAFMPPVVVYVLAKIIYFFSYDITVYALCFGFG